VHKWRRHRRVEHRVHPREVFPAIATPAEGARRDRLFEQVVREQPRCGDYQRQTARTIPVVVLERRTAPEM
jgi:hypothetical protein